MRSADKVMLIETVHPWDQLQQRVHKVAQSIEFNVNAQFDLTRTPRLAILRNGDEIGGIAIASKVRKSGDFEQQIRVEQFTLVQPVIEWAGLAARVPRIGETAAAAPTKGILSPKLAEQVLQALAALRPALAGVIGELLGLLNPTEWENEAARISYEEQKDAISLGLVLAALDPKDSLPETDNRSGESYVRGLPGSLPREDAMLRHDVAQFPDWVSEESQVYDTWSFRDPSHKGRKLTIYYTDRSELEKQTGTDLIYYRHETQSFVLVQYKRLTKKTGEGHAGYRPDTQMDTQIARMEALELRADGPKAPENYRLSPEVCFFKFVDPHQERPVGHRLSPGCHLPLDLLQMLRNHGRVRGPRGGEIITAHNVGRSLNNTDFVSLVQGSWIGTHGQGSDKFRALIAATAADDRGLIIVDDRSDHANSKKRQG